MLKTLSEFVAKTALAAQEPGAHGCLSFQVGCRLFEAFRIEAQCCTGGGGTLRASAQELGLR